MSIKSHKSKSSFDSTIPIDHIESSELNKTLPEYVPLWSFSSTRLYIALILMFVVLCALNMRTNIGMAMVCMVNSTAYTTNIHDNNSLLIETSKNPKCQHVKNPDVVKDLGYHGTYLWNPRMQSALLSSTAYGSFFTILFSGYICDLYGPRYICLGALILYTTITILSPILADWNYYIFLVARSVMGLAEGSMYPAVASLISKWFPANERSTVAAIYTSGNQLGSSMGTFLAARLCLSTFLGGWPMIFYMYGILGIACTILWCLFAANKPEECKFISDKEKNYLKHHLSAVNSKSKSEKNRGLNVPWLKLITSPPVWACVLTRFSFSWNGVVMSMLLPSYLRDVLYLDMSSNGLFTATPLVVQLVSKNILAFLSDYLKKSGKMGLTASTKMLQAYASFGSCLAIFGLITFVDCTRPYLALVFLVIYGMTIAGAISGAYTASLCIAPEFTGTIESLCGIFNVLATITSAMTAGFINKTGSPQEWTFIFIITGCIILSAGIFFLIFGSAEVQPWSKFSKENTEPPKINVVTETPKIQENDKETT